MAATTGTQSKANPIRTALTILLPVMLLAGVIALFLATNGAGLNAEPAAPIERFQIDRATLAPGSIQLDVQNLSPQEITLAQVVINDAFWPYQISPTHTLGRLERGKVTVAYPWVRGEAYEITLLTSSGIKFTHLIEAASQTHRPGSSTLLGFTLIGLYVGVIPIFLGMAWLPVLRRLGARWMMFIMAITGGLLLFLGVDAANEALEQAAGLGGAFQGVGLVAIGIVAIFLLLLSISRSQQASAKPDAAQRSSLALVIAIGIGLHNFGEGLAIGAAYSAGAASLGTFLVIGFVLQNITEGLGIVAPVLKDRPSIRFLVLSGLTGGAPAILGAWIGGVTALPALNVLFLAAGAGAVFEVAYEVAKMLQRDIAKNGKPVWAFSGVLVGMLLLYFTGMWVK